MKSEASTVDLLRGSQSGRTGCSSWCTVCHSNTTQWPSSAPLQRSHIISTPAPLTHYLYSLIFHSDSKLPFEVCPRYVLKDIFQCVLICSLSHVQRHKPLIDSVDAAFRTNVLLCSILKKPRNPLYSHRRCRKAFEKWIQQANLLNRIQTHKELLGWNALTQQTCWM